VKRLAGGQEKFTTDAGVGGHAERPFGIGGKLDGHAPVGDGGHLRIALFALRRGVGLHTGRICRRRALGGEQSLQVRHFGGRDAGQRVCAELGDDGLHGFLERGLVGIEAVADEIVVHHHGIGARIFLARGGLHFVKHGHEAGLGGMLAAGGGHFAGRALRGGCASGAAG
jgi:hypothetical protein